MKCRTRIWISAVFAFAITIFFPACSEKSAEKAEKEQAVQPAPTPQVVVPPVQDGIAAADEKKKEEERAEAARREEETAREEEKKEILPWS